MSTTPGDRDERWRAGYAGTRKDLLRSDDTANRRRLERLGAAAEPLGTVVDLGAGDGNLRAALLAAGATTVVAVEPQFELAAGAAAGGPTANGAAEQLPLRDGAADTVMAMDVLHHVAPERLDDALAEVRRVLRPGGRLLVCEPADTATRRVLWVALRSPLGSLRSSTRHKRAMVQLEWPTLGPWLDGERRFPDRLARAGFEVGSVRRHWLHVDVTGRRPA